MKLPKSLTTVTTFSKILAALLFILFPFIGFRLGVSYQKSVDYVLFNTNDKIEEKKSAEPTLIPSPISSPNKTGWYRYMNSSLDYYIDYPKMYAYTISGETSVSFEKQVNYPHRTNYWIFIDKGPTSQFSQAKLDELKQMKIGEVRVIMKNESSLPSQFKTYERLPDTYFGTKKAMAFVNKNVWEGGEGTHMYVYIYESMDTYIVGGLTNEKNTSEDNIAFSEFKDIVSTLRFLD